MSLEIEVFRAEYAKEVKINYKGGVSYTAKNVGMLTVYESLSGGHDVQYLTDDGNDEAFMKGDVIKSNLHQYNTVGRDVVSVELRNTSINGIQLDRVKQVFIR